VNPLLVGGQVHGGIVQGIGQASMEHVVYDESGQPITGSHIDDALPRANDAAVIPLLGPHEMTLAGARRSDAVSAVCRAVRH
jgi:xanthine dehydrogenase molybdopterin-binding subunit B